jgi:hypothetical protein
MVFRTTKVDTHPTALFPTRDAIARGVQPIVKNNNRTTKWVIVGKRRQHVRTGETLQVAWTIRARL